MSEVISREGLDKLLLKRLEKYSTSIEFVNDMHKFGLTRHSCMILELLLLGRDYSRIKDVLLFMDDDFNSYIEEIYMFLKSFKKKGLFFNNH